MTEKPSAVGMLGIEEDLIQVEGDLCDAAELERVLAENDVDSVFHLAAETIVSTVQESPVQGFESNVRGTWTLLQACLDHGVERVVFASSDKAYGAHETLPYREDFPLQPTAPYEASKAAADLIARSYWHSYGLPVAVTRFANIYGGRRPQLLTPDPRGGERRPGRRGPLSLRSDGSPERDFLYVEDAARGLPRHRRRAGPRRRARRGLQRGRRPLLPCARGDRDDHAARRHGRRARRARHRQPRGRDRPPVRGPVEAPRDAGLGAGGRARGRARANDRVVPATTRRAGPRRLGRASAASSRSRAASLPVPLTSARSRSASLTSSGHSSGVVWPEVGET